MAEGTTPTLSSVPVVEEIKMAPSTTVESTPSAVDQKTSVICRNNSNSNRPMMTPTTTTTTTTTATTTTTTTTTMDAQQPYYSSGQPYPYNINKTTKDNNNNNKYSNGNLYGYNNYNQQQQQQYYPNNFNQYNNNSNYYGGYNNSGYSTNSNAGTYGIPFDSANDDGATVDSALLAALRDQRERVALLRLEQVMIDFMNAPEGYLEVGGPYNSIVVSPNTSSKRFQSAATVVADTGARQTKFQRCLLHRLADRFGIARETGTILEGSIRLIKQKDSKIPKLLLLNHSDETNNACTNSTSRNNNVTSQGESDVAAGDESRSTFQQQPMSASGTSATTSTKDKSKQKMKIMKRNSSVDSNSGQAKNTPQSRKSKNFSDKEKAYAEARARIFADEANAAASSSSSSSNNNNSSSVASQSAPSSSAPSPSETPPPPPNSNSSNALSVSAQPFTGIVRTNSNSTNSVSIPKRMSSSSLTGAGGSGAGAGDIPVDDLPPAATAGGVSKATWRNRREEENDPDFQRGSGLQTMIPVTATAASPYGVPTIAVAGNAYYYGVPSTVGGYPPQHAPAAAQQQQVYYGGGTGRGMPGRVFAAPRGYGYPQHQQQYPAYRTTGTADGVVDAANVNCMEEFPALR